MEKATARMRAVAFLCGAKPWTDHRGGVRLPRLGNSDIFFQKTLDFSVFMIII
jgi:hypothetical protein